MKMTIVGLSTDSGRLKIMVDHKMEPDLIERDSSELVTIYGPQQPDGTSYYVILDQEVLDKLRTLDEPDGQPERHKEDRLCGVVEAALNRCMSDPKWLSDVAGDAEFGITQSTGDEVFLALESYICDHLARITKPTG